MKALTLVKSNLRQILVDILVFLIIYLIPSISHLFSFPIYLLDPMRIVLFAGYILSRNTANTIFLSITLPLFSMIITGHPIFYKAILISTELTVNILLFTLILNKTRFGVFFSILAATVLSKVIYYLLKYTFISIALIEGDLISTDLWLQVIVITALSGLFVVFFKLAKK